MMPTWTRAVLLLIVVYDLFWEIAEVRKNLREKDLIGLVEKLERRTPNLQSLSEQGKFLLAQIAVAFTFVGGIVPHLIAAAFLLQSE